MNKKITEHNGVDLFDLEDEKLGDVILDRAGVVSALLGCGNSRFLSAKSVGKVVRAIMTEAYHAGEGGGF